MAATVPATVDEYIASFPAEVQERMEALRGAILAAAPGVQQKISWGMATFFVGRHRMHFAGHAHHIGLYPGPTVVAAFAPQFEGYTVTKGGIQLPYARPLDLDLIAAVASVVFKG